MPAGETYKGTYDIFGQGTRVAGPLRTTGWMYNWYGYVSYQSLVTRTTFEFDLSPEDVKYAGHKDFAVACGPAPYVINPGPDEYSGYGPTLEFWTEIYGLHAVVTGKPR